MTEHSSARALLQQLQSWKIFLTLLSPALTSSRKGKMTNTLRKYIQWGNKLHLQCWGVLIWIWWYFFLFGVQNSGPTARGSFKCHMETVMRWSHLSSTGMLDVVIYMCMCIAVTTSFILHKRLVIPSAHLGKKSSLSHSNFTFGISAPLQTQQGTARPRCCLQPWALLCCCFLGK